MGHQDDGDGNKCECFVGPNTALHNWLCGLYKGSSKKNQEEEERNEGGGVMRKRDRMLQKASHTGLYKISY